MIVCIWPRAAPGPRAARRAAARGSQVVGDGPAGRGSGFSRHPGVGGPAAARDIFELFLFCSEKYFISELLVVIKCFSLGATLEGFTEPLPVAINSLIKCTSLQTRPQGSVNPYKVAPSEKHFITTNNSLIKYFSLQTGMQGFVNPYKAAPSINDLISL